MPAQQGWPSPRLRVGISVNHNAPKVRYWQRTLAAISEVSINSIYTNLETCEDHTEIHCEKHNASKAFVFDLHGTPGAQFSSLSLSSECHIFLAFF